MSVNMKDIAVDPTEDAQKKDWGKMHDVPTPNSTGVSMPCQLGPSVLAQNDKEIAQECDHKGHYRLAGGSHVAIRMCINCGKSWRLPTQGDYIFGDSPAAEWEEIVEPVIVPELVASNYEE